MRSLRDRESMQRGSPDYPLDYYLIDRNHPRYEMPYHWHAETELLHVISGQFSMTIDEETFLLAAGDAVYIAPGRLHGGKPENCVYECIVFDMHQLMKTNAFCRPLMTDIESRQVDIFPCFSIHAHDDAPGGGASLPCRCPAGGGMGAHHAGMPFRLFWGGLPPGRLPDARRAAGPGVPERAKAQDRL